MVLYSPLQPGDPRRLGRYELLGRLGQGGMGVVFLGQDDLGLVAIKTITSASVSDEEVRRRFRREAEAASRVPRRCTAQVYESDFEHDPPFIVSEYIKGPTLAAEVKEKGPLPASRLYGVAIGVAAALSQIHQVPIVHRDLKPQNVLLSPHGPRVIDFGIARLADQTASSSGHIIGTPAYMAPEHFDHREVDRAADVFAWGSVMAFAGTGRLPFGEGASPQVGYRIIHDPPDLEGLDPTMRRLVEVALRKDPGQRPTASWLQEELKHAARAAKADQGRAMEVDQVLEHAREGPDRPVPTLPLLAAPQAPDGVRPRPLGALFVLAAAVLALGVWLDTLGGLGAVTRSSVRWLFGYGAYALPLLVGWWVWRCCCDLGRRCCGQKAVTCSPSGPPGRLAAPSGMASGQSFVPRWPSAHCSCSLVALGWCSWPAGHHPSLGPPWSGSSPAAWSVRSWGCSIRLCPHGGPGWR